MIGRLAEKTESVRSRVDVHIDPRIGDQSCLDRGYILDRNEGIATTEMHRDMSRDILSLIEMAIDVGRMKRGHRRRTQACCGEKCQFAAGAKAQCRQPAVTRWPGEQ